MTSRSESEQRDMSDATIPEVELTSADQVIRSRELVALLASGDFCRLAARYIVHLQDELKTLQNQHESLGRCLDAEENLHAELQSRCYEGFPSATDGVFSHAKQLQDECEQLRERVKELESKLNRARSMMECNDPGNAKALWPNCPVCDQPVYFAHACNTASPPGGEVK